MGITYVYSGSQALVVYGVPVYCGLSITYSMYTRKSAEYSGHVASQWPHTQEIMDDLEVFDIVP